MQEARRRISSIWNLRCIPCGLSGPQAKQKFFLGKFLRRGFFIACIVPVGNPRERHPARGRRVITSAAGEAPVPRYGSLDACADRPNFVPYSIQPMPFGIFRWVASRVRRTLVTFGPEKSEVRKAWLVILLFAAGASLI